MVPTLFSPYFHCLTFSLFDDHLGVRICRKPLFISSGDRCTHAAAGGDRDLDRVPPRLAHVFQVQRFVGGLVVAPLDGERRGVHADLNRRRPVGVHLTVFVVVALELQLEVRSAGQERGQESEVGQVSCFKPCSTDCCYYQCRNSEVLA